MESSGSPSTHLRRMLQPCRAVMQLGIFHGHNNFGNDWQTAALCVGVVGLSVILVIDEIVVGSLALVSSCKWSPTAVAALKRPRVLLAELTG